MARNQKAHRAGYWWLLATAGGWIVGTAIAVVLAAIAKMWRVLQNAEYIYAFRAGVVFGSAGLVVGMVVGLGQWLVLRGRIRGAGWWILGTTVALGLGNAAGEIVFSWIANSLGPWKFVPFARAMWCWISGGAMCGLILGVAQWLVLRRRARSAGWWIPANILSWAAGAISGQYAGCAVLNLLGRGHSAGWAIVRVPWYDLPVPSIYYMVLNVGYWPGHLVVAVLVGVITGLVLARLLSRPIHDGANVSS